MVKWVRRVDISCAVKPEVRRRSKPCGADVVVEGAAVELVRLLAPSSLAAVLLLGRRAVDEVWDRYCDFKLASVLCARVASDARSAADNASPREQCI